MATHQSPRILLIDDDVDFLEVNTCLLEYQGYHVVSFSNPQRALEQMTREPPDLVVTDLMMSQFDSGFSVAKQIKENPRLAHIPVIIVTAVSSQLGFDFVPQHPDDLKAMYADAFMSKPLSSKSFVEKVEELLELAGKEVHHE